MGDLGVSIKGMGQRSCVLYGLLVGIWAAFPAANAENVTLEPSADTCLFEFNPDFNFGAQSDLPSGTLGAMAGLAKSRMLIKFDVAGAIPANAVISSASLTLNVVVSPVGRANSVFELRRVKLDWNEGNKSGFEPGGARASAGEVTWNSRIHPDVGWEDPGGDFGEDFANESSGQAQVFGLGSYQFNLNAQGLADLELMASNPGGNFGWAVVTRSEETAKTARRWASGDHANAAIRPKLEIEYSIPEAPPEPEILELQLEAASVNIRFLAHPGVHYSLETTDELAGDSWTSVAEVQWDGEEGEAELGAPFLEGRRQFLRIVGRSAD